MLSMGLYEKVKLPITPPNEEVRLYWLEGRKDENNATQKSMKKVELDDCILLNCTVTFTDSQGKNNTSNGGS